MQAVKGVPGHCSATNLVVIVGEISIFNSSFLSWPSCFSKARSGHIAVEKRSGFFPP